MIIINLTLPALTRLHLHLHAAPSTSHTHDMLQLVALPLPSRQLNLLGSPQIHFHVCAFFACALAHLVSLLCNGISGDFAAMNRSVCVNEEQT